MYNNSEEKRRSEHNDKQKSNMTDSDRRQPTN